eukprot:CAMPEP_0201560938 /NCGR_PEP_ID=MMETSP0173_2-20130828/78527_1 /ASSEMBLY_ACC=CAM_ASM_000268 /TAXON_ID=218659 /ORGANISM="Vexillifera sp., Strain DIVA3 564/2" /LENGTH=908 /DNA_ID=CAMNT_0047975403 /DNA_START=31 /DNA_END=2755 /DNA_ORIENTATION=-
MIFNEQTKVVDGGSVVGIDLGAEWYKIGLIQGTTFDVVVNKEGRRKQPSFVGFYRGERVFGRDAERILTRKPSQVYTNTQHLLGKSLSHPFVSENTPKHFAYPLVEIEERSSIGISQGESVYSAEQVLGMVFKQARDTVKESMGSDVTNVVVSVPPFLTHHERAALIEAAELAGLQTLSLINHGTAAAIQFALSRDAAELQLSKNIIFYDIGAASTKISLVQFSQVPKSSRSNQTVPQIQVLSTAWDQTLGGREFDYNLAQHYASKANEMLGAKIGRDIRDDPRAMAKLLAVARKTKEVLSANQQTVAMVEGLIDDLDFRVDIDRETFLSLNTHLLKRVITPLQHVLAESQLRTDQIDAIEILGGGTRIPRIQQIIGEYMQQPISMHLNSDEAMVLGATFHAATLSASFRVRSQFKIRDYTPYPIDIDVVQGGGLEDDERHTTLVSPKSRYGAKKNLSFKTTDPTDIKMVLSYPKSSASADPTDGAVKPNRIPIGSDLPIVSYDISGLPTMERFNYTGKPKLVFGFRLQSNGLITLESAEAEYTILEYPQQIDDEQYLDESNGLDGSNGSNGSDDESNDESNGSNDESNDESDESNASDESDESNASDGNDGSDDDESNDESDESNASDESDESNASDGNDGSDASDDESNNTDESSNNNNSDDPPLPVKKIRRAKLTIKTTPLGVLPMSVTEKVNAKVTLNELDRKEELKRNTERTKNTLEAHIYDTRDRLESNEDWISHSTEEERSALRELLLDTGDWLYDEGEDVTLEAYQAKLDELKLLSDKIAFRISEGERLPEAFAFMKSQILRAQEITSNITAQRNVTEQEVSAFSEKLSSESEWLEEAQKTVEQHDLTLDPVITTEQVKDRIKSIVNQVKVFQKRPKLKPKIEPIIIDDQQQEQQENDEQ